MAVAKQPVETLICESCQWVERRDAPVIEMWTRETSHDFCDLCSAKRAAAQAKRDEERKAT
jgi:hypothetical protein